MVQQVRVEKVEQDVKKVQEVLKEKVERVVEVTVLLDPMRSQCIGEVLCLCVAFLCLQYDPFYSKST